MTAPSLTQLGEAFLTLTPHLAGTLHQATITPHGLRIEVTDPAAQRRIVDAHRLTRTHSFTGCYVGVVSGAPVTVAISRVIPARQRQSGEVA